MIILLISVFPKTLKKRIGNSNHHYMIPLQQIDKSWTVFLDRDGVINEEKRDNYIHKWEEFRFNEGVLEAIAVFSKIFHRIVVVTNQRGVGKGTTQLKDLDIIHQNMIKAIEDAGGRIDAVYFCPDLNDDSPNRKPNPGMGLQAISRFPEIDPAKSIMIGNTLSDMGFGRNLGAYTVYLTTTHPDIDLSDNRIDMICSSLHSFASALHTSTNS